MISTRSSCQIEMEGAMKAMSSDLQQNKSNSNDGVNEGVILKAIEEANEKYSGCALAQDGRQPIDNLETLR